MSPSKPVSPAKKRIFVIDWTLEGSIQIEADSADEAQALFDKRFKNGMPRFISDGEISNFPPAEASP